MSDIISQIPQADYLSQPYFRLFKEGNERGLYYIYKELYTPLFSIARKIIQDEFEIGTIIQEAFLLIWERREKMENVAHIKNFICKRIRWDCYTYLKKNKIRCTIPLEWCHSKEVTTAVYAPQTIAEQHEKALIEQEQIQLIEKAILYLPANRKTFIKLRKCGFSYKRIAKYTGLSYQHIIQKEKESIKELKAIANRLSKVERAAKHRPVIVVADYKAYLSHSQVQILKLHYEKAYSFKEISQELNITLWEAINQYFLIIQKLKKLNRPESRNINSQLHLSLFGPR